MSSDIVTPDEKARTPIAISSSHALPQVAIDELWRRRQPRIISGWPLPQAPSHDAAVELLADKLTLKASEEFAAALASVIPSGVLLDEILAALPNSDAVAFAAAWNPHMSKTSRATRSFSHITATGTTAGAVVTRRFLEADIDGCIDALFDQNLESEMSALLVRVSSIMRASSPEVAKRVIDTFVPEADAWVAEDLTASDACMNQWVLRAMRGAVLDRLQAADPVKFAIIGAEITNTGRLVDPYVVAAIDAAFSTGLLPDDVKLNMSAYSQARAEVICDEASPLRAQKAAPAVSHKRKKEAAPMNIIDSDQDLYLAGLELLGLSDAAARLAVSAGNLSDEEFVSRLGDADADTIVDWAERRLGQQPVEGQVAEVIDQMASDRQREVLAEVLRRPNPIELQPELALCLPDASLLQLDERGSVFVAVTATRSLGENTQAWALALELLVQGWEPTFLELIRSVEALVLNPQ
jgi:hypothetical protein